MRCGQNPRTTANANYWIMESLPCFMEGLEWRGTSLTLERPPSARVSNFLRLKAEGLLRPLPGFFALSQAGYSSAEHYDQGTAVFWYLMRQADSKGAARFLGLVKHALSARPIDDVEEKAYPNSLAVAAADYAEWYAHEFGSPERN